MRKNKDHIQSAGGKFIRYVIGCSKAAKIRYETIRSVHYTFSRLGNDMIEKHKTKWKDHVDRIVENRLTKKIMNYWQIGQRNVNRSCKRWSRTGNIT